MENIYLALQWKLFSTTGKYNINLIGIGKNWNFRMELGEISLTIKFVTPLTFYINTSSLIYNEGFLCKQVKFNQYSSVCRTVKISINVLTAFESIGSYMSFQFV